VAAQDELWGALARGEPQRGLGEIRVLLGVRSHAENEALAWVVGKLAERVRGEQGGLGGVSLVGRLLGLDGRPVGLDERDDGKRADDEQGSEQTGEDAPGTSSPGGLLSKLPVAAGGQEGVLELGQLPAAGLVGAGQPLGRAGNG
jgi:hypothetical protein